MCEAMILLVSLFILISLEESSAYSVGTGEGFDYVRENWLGLGQDRR